MKIKISRAQIDNTQQTLSSQNNITQTKKKEKLIMFNQCNQPKNEKVNQEKTNRASECEPSLKKHDYRPQQKTYNNIK